MHEKQFHELSVFLTCTYSDEKLPARGSLDKAHFPAFMKRLRAHVWREWRKRNEGGSPPKLAYFHCGEYGESTGRPHYHAILYGVDFSDKRAHSKSHSGTLYKSELLDRLWGHGHCTMGDVTFESAAYVARYVMKKITGPAAKNHYQRIDPESGEIYQLVPEYVTMSLRPGIGKRWFDAFSSDLYPDDFAVVRGKRARVPSYYDVLLKRTQPLLLEAMKLKRAQRALEPANMKNQSRRRLADRETVKRASISTLKRELE